MECSSITDKSVKLLKSPIESLFLSNCYNLTDEAIIAVSENLPDLKDLNLHSCQLVTNTSIIRVAANLRGLKTLDIRNTKASDLAVEAIVTNLSLKVLFLCYCDITDKSIHQIATSQLELEKFNFCECFKVTDNAVIELATLDRLTRVYCDETNITDQSLYAFAAKTTPLIELSIRNCPHVTRQGRDAVRSRVKYFDESEITGYYEGGDDDDDDMGDGFEGEDELNMNE
jgi:F-box and leucine-rich repeat protein GRR1